MISETIDTLSLSSLTFTITTALASYLGYRCFREPKPPASPVALNPRHQQVQTDQQIRSAKTTIQAHTSSPPKPARHANTQNSISTKRTASTAAITNRSIHISTPPPSASTPRTLLVRSLKSYRFYILLSAPLHTLFSLSPTLRSPPFCRVPGNLEQGLFVWNAYTAAALACVIVGGAIRITAYRQLGDGFTYELGKPGKSGLVTGGVYTWVRHPSYSSGYLCVVGILMLFGRFDGGIGCFVPKSMVRGLTVWQCSWVFVMFIGLTARIYPEEKMLEKEF